MSEKLEQLYTVQEVARSFKVSEETIRRWIKNKDIPYVPVGPFKLKRLRPEDLTKEVSNGK